MQVTSNETPNYQFTVKQLDIPFSKKEKLEAKLAEAIGKRVSASENPVLNKINGIVKEFLVIRNEVIEKNNALLAYKEQLSNAKGSGELDELGKIIDESDLIIEKSDSRLNEKKLGSFTKLFLSIVQNRAEKSKEEVLEAKDTLSKTRLQKQIQEKMIKLNSSEMAGDEKKAARDDLQRELDLDVLALRTYEMAPVEEIARGKAKRVWAKRADPKNAYFTPVTGVFNRVIRSKEIEIREEVETAHTVENKLKDIGVNSAGSHLALELEEMTGKDKIEGHYTVKTEKAQGDLEHEVNKGTLTFPTSALIGLQIVKGMNNLHKVDYVHGDIKLENVLVYKTRTPDGSEKIEVKISDFGKTRPLERNQSVMHTGNYRFIAPEGRLSQQSEVFGTAIMVIRALEGELLTSKDMLKEPTNRNSSTETKKRYGIENFLVTNQDCPQTETVRLVGKMRAIGNEVKAVLTKNSPESLQKAQKETHDYIDVLVKELKTKYNNNDKQVQIGKLGDLLKQMTLSNPNERPSLSQVELSYASLLGL